MPKHATDASRGMVRGEMMDSEGGEVGVAQGMLSDVGRRSYSFKWWREVFDCLSGRCRCRQVRDRWI